MDKRGGALVNVLMVTSVLMILGVVALQIVVSDTNFSRLDFNRSQAFHLAEGGIDYAINQIVGKEEGVSIDGTYQPSEGLTVEITELDENHFLILSTAVVHNSTRAIEVELLYDPMEFPFAYSLYVGEEVVGDLRNVTFNSPVYIAACSIEFGPNVYFNAGVHFECENVVFNDGKYTKENPPFVVAAGYEATYGDTGTEFPEVEISALAVHAVNDDPITNNPDSTVVDFSHLTSFNYYKGDVEIVWSGKVESPAMSGYIVIVSEGNVRFNGNSNIDYKPEDDLIVLAAGTVSGNHNEDIQNIQLPLYIYSMDEIMARNNLTNLRSLIGKRVGMGSGTNVVSELPEGIPGLEEVWPSVIKILRWKN